MPTLSEFHIFLIIGFIVPLPLLAYVIYWALEIRHALFVRLYRNQALGVALVAVAVVLSTYGGIAPAFSLPSGVEDVTGAAVFFAFLLLFYWIDISLRAARRSDPLLRDTLHWSQVRKVLWPLYLGILAILVVWIVLDLGNFLLFLAPPLIVVISGLLYLPTVARRSKDPVLRRHFVWFGLFFIGFFLAGFGELGNFPFDMEGDLLTIAGLLLSGYFLYRSARSLVPLNEIEPEAS